MESSDGALRGMRSVNMSVVDVLSLTPSALHDTALSPPPMMIERWKLFYRGQT